jgi:hypothetical protein
MGGEAQFIGANVVLRNLEDPYILAATAVSGDVSPDGTADPAGWYRFEGLPPGNYTLEVRPVASIFTGPSSVGRANREGSGVPTELGAPAEYLNLAESSDGFDDRPADYRVLTLGETDLTSGLDVYLNDLDTLIDGLSGSGNNTFDDATLVSDQGDVLGDVIAQPDVDYYRIFLPQGWTLRVDVDAVDGGLDSSLSPIVRLLDAGESILYDKGLGISEPGVEEIADPATGLTGGIDPAIDYTTSASGDLVVAVAASEDTGFTGSNLDETGPYYLRLTPRPPTRDREPRIVGGGGFSDDGSAVYLFGSMPVGSGAWAESLDGTIVAVALVPPSPTVDADGDGVPDPVDICPGSTDTDADGVCDDVDNCPVANPQQRDGNGNGIGDRCDPPTVVAVAPPDQEYEVQRAASATVTFSEPMDPATLTAAGAIELQDPYSAPVPTDLTISSGDRAATLDPDGALDATTTYTVQVAGSVEDQDGVTMAVPFSSSFTTRAGTTDTVQTGEIGSDYEGHEQTEPDVSARFGQSVATRGDANGDGIKDVLIAGPRADSQKGKVKLLFGEKGAVKNGTSKSLVFVGAQAGDLAGTSVSFVPDMNDDGIADIFIGAPGANPESDPGGSPGAAYLVFGQTDLDLVTGPVDLSTIDDVSCDPCGVILVGETADDLAGRSVSAAGDLNGDSLPDLLVGAPGADPLARSGAGIVYVIFGDTSLEQPGLLNLDDVGSLSLPGVQFLGENPGDRAGRALSDWQDLAHDGKDDILIGAPGADVRLADDSASLTDAGVVYAVMGKNNYPGSVDLDLAGDDSSQLPSIVFVGTTDTAQAGYAVWGRDDVTGDGENDILIGAPGMTYLGKVDVGACFIVPSLSDDDPIKGRESGTVDLNPDNQGPALGNSTNLHQLGTDLNVSQDMAGMMATGQNTGDKAGFSVGSAGDLDGDGIAEVLVGAPGYDADGATDSTLADAGRVYVLLGQRSRTPGEFGLEEAGLTVPGLVIEGSEERRRLGEAVSGLGDIDDSGTAELVLGAPGDETTPPDGGKVYISMPVVAEAVRDLRVEKTPAHTLEWAAAPGAVDYAVYRGDLADLRIDGEVRTLGTCAVVPGLYEVDDRDADDRPDFEDDNDPADGAGFWYLVAGTSGYGRGPIGAASSGAPRVNDEITCP